VAESAVVGFPHEIKGQGIFAFVILKAGAAANTATLTQWVAREISPIAKPDRVVIVPGLPKTRSGKIMRRILRKIAEGDLSNLGDTQTLADPSIVGELVNRVALAKD
jgi:acetyl-CoA synthetase